MSEQKSITRTTEASLAPKDAAAAAVIQEESRILACVEQGQMLPASRVEQNKIGDIIGQNVFNRFGGSLSPADRELWLSFNSGPPVRTDSRGDSDRTRLNDKYNKFVLANVFHYGLALLLDADMMRRVFSWESQRPDLMRRFYENLQRRTKALRGEKHIPITKEHGTFKRSAKVELGQFVGKFRKQRTRRRAVTNSEFADRLKEEAEARPGTVSNLFPYLMEIDRFIRSCEPEFAALILDGSITAATFLDRWFASTHGVTVPYARQKLSGRSG